MTRNGGMIGKYALVACFFLAACADQPEKPVPVYDLKLSGHSTGAAFVHEGETIAALAQRYRLTIDDLIRANITHVQAGQRIVLPPPQTYAVRAGDTVASVAGMFDARTADIIEQNNLMPPYVLRVGQVLQLPGPRYESVRIASIAPPTRSDAIDAVPLAAEPAGAPRPPRMEQISLTPTLGKFQAPVKGQIISGYGAKTDGLYNDGINIAAAPGTPVHAAGAGEVAYAGDSLEGYGNLVLIKHDDGYFTVYSHLADTRVAKGVKVARGQTIGSVGASGKVSSPQLHFEIRQGTKSLNPADYL